ncbi:hypothetical protein A3K71_03400 [archaeon RBG_16_50_20]|nr:MAG: hypothetical protein A3K71_03400 [archaeon RBG_16_50_20]
MNVEVVRPREAAEALQTLMRYIEQLEESLRRSKMPEVRLTVEELRQLDEAANEMDNKDASITLDEFNQGPSSKVQRKSTS